jgi:hypothetical protein
MDWSALIKINDGAKVAEGFFGGTSRGDDVFGDGVARALIASHCLI